MTKLERKFVLEHVFRNVSEMKDMEHNSSDMKMHFGIPWRICVIKQADHLGAYLFCEPTEEGYWSVETKVSLEIVSPLGKTISYRFTKPFKKWANTWGTNALVSWADMVNNYKKDNKILLKCHVTVKNITGIAVIEKKKLKKFDESMGDLSDVILKIGNEKFHVSRMVLASYSSYFKSLFFGKFDEAKKSEIELKDIDPTVFQDFLEMIYGESALNDNNMEGLLKLAEMYDVPTVMRKCEEYLLNQRFLTSKIPNKKKLLLASQFNLANLLQSILDEQKTIQEVRSILPSDLEELSAYVAREIIQKMAEVADLKS